MSLPARSSVWSASSLPGTAGSGICFTQTAMFIRFSVEVVRRPGAPGHRHTPLMTRFLPRSGRSGETWVPSRPLSESVLDVLVAGAGPAGVAAGIEARRMGLSALVVDKATFPRDKTCGDGLTTGALRLLDRLGFDVRTLPSWAAVQDTVIVSPSSREVVLSLPPD